MAPPSTLPTRRLGKDGSLIPALGFGLMGLSVAYGSGGYVSHSSPYHHLHHHLTHPSLVHPHPQI